MKMEYICNSLCQTPGFLLALSRPGCVIVFVSWGRLAQVIDWKKKVNVA